jgi:pilus assembly protein CpaF
MSNPNNPFQSNSYRNLRKRLRDTLLIELEGTLNTQSKDEMYMFEKLFGEVLAEERVVLSRTERLRLYDDVVADIVEASRR